MASLSGVSSSNTVSSLMNSANMISGLASGLDTESMIESLVQSYQTKISSLNQQVTKIEWKQDAYRSIISKAVGFSSKYASYTSSTNLLSASFFSNAVKVAAQGVNASKVSATGKTNSDISIDAVKQLATAAQYRTNGNLTAGDGRSILATGGKDRNGNDIQGIDMLGKTELGVLSGSLTLTYGSKSVSVSFDEVADVKALQEIREKGGQDMTDAEALAELINQKLDGQTITFTSGGSDTAENRIKAVAYSDGTIDFTDPSGAGNSLYISGASGNVKLMLGLDLENASEKMPKTIDVDNLGGNEGDRLTKQVNTYSYLSGASMNINLDGTTKTITAPRVGYNDLTNQYILTDKDGQTFYVDEDKFADKYAEALNSAVQEKFGDKITVTNAATDGSLQLNFKMKNEGSDLVINTDVGEALGIGRSSTSYLNTSKTLEDLLGSKLDGLSPAKKKDQYGVEVLDTDEKTGELKYAFNINGVEVGRYTKDTKLSTILNDINSNKDANVKVSYSQVTQEFVFTSKETGVDSKIDISGGLAEAMFGTTNVPEESKGTFAEAYGLTWLGEGDTEAVTFQFDGFHLTLRNVTSDMTIEDVANQLNKSIFNDGYTASYNKYTGQLEVTDKSGAPVKFGMKDSYGDDVNFDESYAPGISYTPGQDAKFTATVNGKTMDMVRSSNSVSLDGLTVTLKETFEAATEDEKVTFKTTTDSDKIVDAVKSMISDYNAMMAEIKSAYSTLPYQKSSGSFANYEPLTDEEREGMSESAIERYEEKAKQGILFNDRNLSRMYEKLYAAFNPANSGDSGVLSHIGINTSYSIEGGAMTVTLDEDKFRAALENEPDLVQEAFTKTAESSGTDGIMQTLKNTLDSYAKTSGEPKGILVQQAGTPLSSLSLLSNAWQTQIDNLNTQIEKWQDKLSNQVDRYTSQFSRLEQLINQMNSQSSTLAGMMGG